MTQRDLVFLNRFAIEALANLMTETRPDTRFHNVNQLLWLWHLAPDGWGVNTPSATLVRALAAQVRRRDGWVTLRYGEALRHRLVRGRQRRRRRAPRPRPQPPGRAIRVRDEEE